MRKHCLEKLSCIVKELIYFLLWSHIHKMHQNVYPLDQMMQNCHANQ